MGDRAGLRTGGRTGALSQALPSGSSPLLLAQRRALHLCPDILPQVLLRAACWGPGGGRPPAKTVRELGPHLRPVWEGSWPQGGRGEERGVVLPSGRICVHTAPCSVTQGSAGRAQRPDQQEQWSSQEALCLPSSGFKAPGMCVRNTPPRGRNATGSPWCCQPCSFPSRACPWGPGPAPPQLPEWPPPGLLSWLCHLQASQPAALCLSFLLLTVRTEILPTSQSLQVVSR